ncbi:hypothetical protein amb2417 [Paramagnetospirillum magneticum AMB-1]|uniref:Uncharacterized protein n=1 Tax=Paramagnetospirillum magneticum (strain ATCC 700264 / AMB-1) TaxID=342108 RepID=Q2W4K4_PARM1|nr:hypothetical protein amb2417 [Paramagnetospirillum magneticum AMB-1]
MATEEEYRAGAGWKPGDVLPPNAARPSDLVTYDQYGSDGKGWFWIGTVAIPSQAAYFAIGSFFLIAWLATRR